METRLVNEDEESSRPKIRCCFICDQSEPEKRSCDWLWEKVLWGLWLAVSWRCLSLLIYWFHVPLLITDRLGADQSMIQSISWNQKRFKLQTTRDWNHLPVFSPQFLSAVTCSWPRSLVTWATGTTGRSSWALGSRSGLWWPSPAPTPPKKWVSCSLSCRSWGLAE